MTSNYPPDGLYPNGLQRQKFLPTIRLIEQWLDVVEVDAGVDYRLRVLEQVEAYHTPLGADGRRRARCARSSGCAAGPTRTRGCRSKAARSSRKRRAGSAVWFDFAALCDGPRSQLDYLELAERFSVLLLSACRG